MLSDTSHTDGSDRRWMTLNEAIEHIQTTKACGSVVAAQVQLKQGISRGANPVKWADSKNGPNMPLLRDFARLQLVLAEPGFAPDRVSFSLRPLLVLRSAVIDGWASTGEETKNRPEKGEGEQWMSLVEAVEHIRMSRGAATRSKLYRQLKGEVGDGMVPIQWDAPNSTIDRTPAPIADLCGLQNFRLLGGGFAPDENAEPGTFRPLLVDRFAVKRLWPLPSSRREEPDQTQSDSSEGGRSAQASKEQIRAVLRVIYANAGDSVPTLTTLGTP